MTDFFISKNISLNIFKVVVAVRYIFSDLGHRCYYLYIHYYYSLVYLPLL